MKNETFIVSDNIVNNVYKDFVADKMVFGISALFKKYHLGSKSGAKVRSAIYEKYGEKEVKNEANRRLGKYRRSKITGTYIPTEETLKKRSDSAKRAYVNNPNLREIARKNAYRTIAGRTQTDEEKLKRANKLRGKKRTAETRKKMSDSNKYKGKKLPGWYRKALSVPKSTFRTGFKLTESHKRKLSRVTKKQWINGIHKSTYRSRGQIEVEKIIKELGYEVKPEFLIEGRPYDTLVVSKNLLIEYNGTFWHRDPRFFYKEQTHRGNCVLAEKNGGVWKRDAEKIDLAKRNGYGIVVVWQHDWENCADKEAYVKNILQYNGL